MYKTQFSSSGPREDLKNLLQFRGCFYAMLLSNSREKSIHKQDNKLTSKCNKFTNKHSKLIHKCSKPFHKHSKFLPQVQFKEQKCIPAQKGTILKFSLLRWLLLWWNMRPKATWNNKGLFCLHFCITGYRGRKSQRKLKAGRNLEAGSNTEAMEGYWLTSNGLFSLVSMAPRTTRPGGDLNAFVHWKDSLSVWV